jgi:hypothetical protein
MHNPSKEIIKEAKTSDAEAKTSDAEKAKGFLATYAELPVPVTGRVSTRALCCWEGS